MRLFLGVSFEEKLLDEIHKCREELRTISIKGNFTHKENYHLTLIFLGEIEENRVADICEAMESIDTSPFFIEFDRLGKFRRKGGDIYWIGFKESVELLSLHNKLKNKLIKKGFEIEDRPYRPHLTLGRRIVLNNLYKDEVSNINIPKEKIEVTKIHLFHSHRINGKLIYSPINSSELYRR